MILEKQDRILVVDDAKDTQMLLDFDLSAADYIVTCCDSGEEAISLLETQEIDLILLDMYMPGLSGLDTLVKLKETPLTTDIPVIMLSASTDEDEVVAALELGAGDYVSKPYVAKILLARIRTAIRLKEKTTQLEYLAKTDFLTGINNRGSFFHLSTSAINLANRAGQSFAVVMFDIDFFKPINDNYGHDAGDQVLRVFSQSLTEAFRGYDIIGRVGGEEFAAFLPNTSRESATVVCERFREHVENLSVNVLSDKNVPEDINITVSIGLVVVDDEGEEFTIDELLKEADNGLYYAKRHGRNQVVDASLIDKVDDIDETEILDLSDLDNQAPVQENNMVTNFDGIDFDIGVNNVLGDQDLFNEILVMFYQDHNLDGSKLQTALESKDMGALKHLAHTLKGVAASVGAMDLFEVTKALDAAVNNTDFNDIEIQFQQVSPELTRVMNSIESNLDVS